MNAEMSQTLTRTGPNTPMGALLRRYWVPILLSSEIAEPDCPPVRVQILGEKLLAFRDTSGRPGLIDEFCAHRGASLWFGRNEENGIRCSYHGLKFTVTGECIDPEISGNTYTFPSTRGTFRIAISIASCSASWPARAMRCGSWPIRC